VLYLLCCSALLLPIPLHGSAGADETPRRPDELSPEPLSFSFPEPDSARLDNGIPVFLFPSHELPLVTVEIRFRMGTRFLPADQHAVGSILSRLWDTGGTQELAPEALEDTLAALDATVSAWMGSRVGGVRAFLAAEDLEAVLPMWRDVVLHPGFDPDRLDRARKQALKDVQAINNDPYALADQHFERLIYGREYPGIHVDSREEIEGVDREAVLATYRRFVQPGNAVIGVSGDFDSEAILALLNSLFASWGTDDRFEPPIARPWPVVSSPGVYYLPGDYDQSHIRVGRVIPGLDRTSPEYPAARILGFGLGYERVFYRSRMEGLSYGTGITFSIGEDVSYWYGFGSGRSEVTAELVSLVREEVERVTEDPLTPEEVEAARIFMLGIEIRGSETSRDMVSKILDAVCLDRPPGYLDTNLEGLKSASVGDLQTAAMQYLSTDSLVVLVVGRPEAFVDSLKALGWGEPVELEPILFGE